MPPRNARAPDLATVLLQQLVSERGGKMAETFQEYAQRLRGYLGSRDPLESMQQATAELASLVKNLPESVAKKSPSRASGLSLKSSPTSPILSWSQLTVFGPLPAVRTACRLLVMTRTAGLWQEIIVRQILKTA